MSLPSELINSLKHMADDHPCCRETIKEVISEIEYLQRRDNYSQTDLEGWERWAREVCTDFRVPFDNHPIGLKMAIVKALADSRNELNTMNVHGHTPSEMVEIIRELRKHLEDVLCDCASHGDIETALTKTEDFR